jgi:hypothetical protein
VIRLERPAVPEVLRSTGARLGLWNRRRTRAATPPELDQFLYGAEVFDALIAMSYTWENLLPARADRIRAKGNHTPPLIMHPPGTDSTGVKRLREHGTGYRTRA